MNLKLGSFVLAATVALSVNGCWQKTEQTVEVEAEMVPVLDVYAGKNEEKNLKLLVQAYEKENQDVSIELHWIPDSEYSQQMMRIKNGESEADCIFFPEAGEAAIWKNKKILKNLSPWYETKNQVNASLYGDVEKDGALYMIPYRVGKICVYYNKTLFDSRGVEYPQENWTWEDYREKALRPFEIPVIAWIILGSVAGVVLLGALIAFLILRKNREAQEYHFRHEQRLKRLQDSGVSADEFNNLIEQRRSAYTSKRKKGRGNRHLKFK